MLVWIGDVARASEAEVAGWLEPQAGGAGARAAELFFNKFFLFVQVKQDIKFGLTFKTLIPPRHLSAETTVGLASSIEPLEKRPTMAVRISGKRKAAFSPVEFIFSP